MSLLIAIVSPILLQREYRQINHSLISFIICQDVYLYPLIEAQAFSVRVVSCPLNNRVADLFF